MRFKSSVLIIAVLLSAAGCKRKPAYSDMDVNRARASENQPAPGQQPTPAQQPVPGNPVPESLPGTEPPDAGSGQQASQQAMRLPAFVNATRGEASDLPNYPRATRQNVRYGPYEGLDMYAASLLTRDPMDKIAAFYDDAIKRNGWTVSSRIVDPEYSEWIMKKNHDDDAGKIVVQKDKDSNRSFITVARTGKPPATPAPTPRKQS